MKLKKESDTKSLKLVGIFLLFVGALIACSLIVKSVTVVSQSVFDGQHRFTVLFFETKDTFVEKPLLIASFAPDTQKISLLKVTGLKAKSSAIDKTVTAAIKIPIDAKIKIPSSNETIVQQSADDLLQSALLHFSSLDSKVTLYDIVRLFLMTKQTPSYNVASKELSLPKQEQLIDTVAASLFADTTFAQENITISIINGTDIPGLGNRLARVITNMGGTVVAVSGTEKEVQHSEMRTKEADSYVATKLQKMLGYPIKKMQKSEISDIVITIGEDKGSAFVY